MNKVLLGKYDKVDVAFTMLAIAVVLYMCHGIIQLMIVSSVSMWWVPTLAGILCLAVGYPALKFINEDAMAISGAFFVTISTYYISNIGGFSFVDLLFCLGLGLGILEFAWFLSGVGITLLYGLVGTFLANVCYSMSEHSFFDVEIFIPILIPFIWKGINTYVHTKVLKENIRHEKLMAFRATVVRLKHEFNNVGAIILGTSEIINEIGISEKLLTRLTTSLKRFMEVIKSIESTDTFEVEPYTSEEDMVVIGSLSEQD